MPLVSGGYPVKSPDWLLSGVAGGVQIPRMNMSRWDVVTDAAAALTTQVMTDVAIALQPGDLISKLAVKAGATAAVTPTNWWLALYDPNGNLLAQTADQLTAAIAADATLDLALVTPQSISTPGIYRVGIMVKAGTVPSLVGVTLARAALSTGILAADKPLSRTSGAALTTTAPATIVTPTSVATVPLVVAH